MTVKKFIIGLILLFSFSSCMLLLGIDKKPNWLTDEELTDIAEKSKNPNELHFMMDTMEYYNEWKNLYGDIFKNIEHTEDSTEYKKQKGVAKDDMQPVQFRLFDSSGSEIFKIVNCYVEKPIKADWNVDGCFDHFPPSINDESLNTHNFDLDFLLATSYSPSNRSKPALSSLPKADYYGVIIWNDIYHKYSKKLIKTVQDNIRKTDKSVVLLNLNNHNYQIWHSVDNKTKSAIKSEISK